MDGVGDILGDFDGIPGAPFLHGDGMGGRWWNGVYFRVLD